MPVVSIERFGPTCCRAVLCAAALLTVACSGGDGSLSGSLGDSYSLSFQTTRARIYSSEFAIEYVAGDGQVPVRVSVERDPSAGLTSGTYDLRARGDITGQRGDTRIPRFLSGSIVFSQFSTDDDAAIVGHFDAKLDTGRDESTLSGDFDTTLEVVDGPTGYQFDTGADAGDTGNADAADADLQRDTD